MIRFHTSHAPLVIVEWVGTIRDEHLEAYMRAHQTLLETGADHGLVVDIAYATIFETGREHLLKLSRWLDRHADVISETCHGCAFVTNDDAFRETVSAYFDLQPFEVPAMVFAERSRAFEWLQPLIGFADTENAEGEGIGEPHSDPELVETDESGGDADSERTEWSPYPGNRPGQSTPVSK